MTCKEELLASFDEAWSDAWESLESVTKNLTEEEALYQHPSYSDVPLEEGHPPSGTVLWHLVHLAHCYRHYCNVIRERPAQPADPPVPEAHSVQEALDNLRHYRLELRNTIAALTEEELEDKLYHEKSIAKFARAIVRHDAWHGGQIAVARRLFRSR